MERAALHWEMFDQEHGVDYQSSYLQCPTRDQEQHYHHLTLKQLSPVPHFSLLGFKVSVTTHLGFVPDPVVFVFSCLQILCSIDVLVFTLTVRHALLSSPTCYQDLDLWIYIHVSLSTQVRKQSFQSFRSTVSLIDSSPNWF